MRRAAFAAVLLLAGCGGGDRRSPAPTPSPTVEAEATPTQEQLVGKLLQRRGQALAAGRARAFARTSLPARRDAAYTAATRVARLGLRRPHYEIRQIRVNGRHARIESRLTYGVRGVRGNFGSERRLTAERRHGRWFVDRALGTRDAEPWEVDDYVRVTTPHFVVFTPGDIVPPSDALEVGYMRIEDLLPKAPLQHRYLAVVARDGRTARRITRNIEGLESLTALTDTQLGPGTEIASQRLIVVESVFALDGVEGQQQVVTHELTHAVLARYASGRTPAWLVEGIAMYVSADDRRTEYASIPTVPTLAALSLPSAIARLQGEQQRAAYAASSSAAFLVADRYGRDKLFELYRAFAKGGPRRGSARYSDRILRRVLGVSLDELQRSLG